MILLKKVAIFGAGPAGMVAAHHLMGSFDVTLYERGESLESRTSVTEGFGGAGAYSDGKMTLGTKVGNSLFNLYGDSVIAGHIKHIDKWYMEHGAPSGRIKHADYYPALLREFRAAGFSLREGAVRHWGTDNGQKIVANIHQEMKDKVDIHYNVDPYAHLANFHVRNGKLIFEDYDYVILAVGRSGATFIVDFYKHLPEVPFIPGATDIGVRYETTNDVFEDVYELSYEPKLTMRSSFDDPVRLFCACLQDGYVVREDYPHLLNKDNGKTVQCVNGHSYTEGSSGNANFAILVTVEFTRPFRDPNAYCCAIAEMVNSLSGADDGVIMQAFGDLKKFRRSTDKRIMETGIHPSLTSAVPGDCSFALPARHLTGIIEFVDALESVFPGVSNGIMYAPEMKLYSAKAVIDREAMTYQGFENLYPIGDGSGWTRSLCGASIHGKMVADKILERESK